MRETPPLAAAGWLGLALVLALAAGTRIGYLVACCDGGATAPRYAVQGQGAPLEFDAGTTLREQEKPTEFDNLVHNLRQADYHWFGSLAPLADKEEQTAHVAPGYFWFASMLPSDTDIRRVQTVLSILTVLCLFLFTRVAFANNLVATIVGVLAALNPFWIINEAELADGTVATFLVASSLALGTVGVRGGGPLGSVLFGLSLAGMALVRATLLPFALLALAWFLFRCRLMRMGWFAGLLVLLGFGNGLAPWLLRNHSVFKDVLPVSDSTYLHLWMGVAPGATGGPMDEKALRDSLKPERVKELVDESNQAKRYRSLARDVAGQVGEDPSGAVAGRFAAGSRFLLGDAWFQKKTLVDDQGTGPDVPPAVVANIQFAHQFTLLVLLVLGIAGWRLSAGWAVETRLATFALLAVPLPYLLSHAEMLSGPRLPWDAPLIVFAGYAIAWLFPAVRRQMDLPAE